MSVTHEPEQGLATLTSNTDRILVDCIRDVCNEQGASELPLYQCHKRVRAAKIEAINDAGVRPEGSEVRPGEWISLGAGLKLATGKIFVSEDWLQRHKPEAGGYYVVYEDGHTSYSPAKAFEEGYAPVPTSHADRIRAEKAALDGNLGRLRAFIGENPLFWSLTAAEQARMRRQEHLMGELSVVLGGRIDAAGVAATIVREDCPLCAYIGMDGSELDLASIDRSLLCGRHAETVRKATAA